jgi:putative membrane protein insertion efficiency factor
MFIFFMFFFNFPKKITIFLINIYQKTLSFDHGPLKMLYPYGYCRFSPTCSEYSKQAVDRFGLVKGGFMAFCRVLRCNPWSKGGIDEVPITNNSGVRGPDDESSVGKDRRAG